MKVITQLTVVTALASIALGVTASRGGDILALWLTSDQQGRLAYENLEFSESADLFEDPTWKATASYAAGRYLEAADTFVRVPSAEAFYNRGNAFLKGREYGKAITAYEQAVADASAWLEAAENLQLSRYVLEYIEGTREQLDTLNEDELGADDYKFDNERERGLEMIITQQSTIEQESADKWMRSVDTDISDFLRTRFELEASRVAGQ